MTHCTADCPHVTSDAESKCKCPWCGLILDWRVLGEECEAKNEAGSE